MVSLKEIKKCITGRSYLPIFLKGCSFFGFGDFNQILFAFEKNGRRLGDSMAISLFQDVIDICSLPDLSYIGTLCTWFNGRCSDDMNAEW